MAKVDEVFPSEDGLVRKVKLKMAKNDLKEPTKYLERPIHKLLVIMESSSTVEEPN